MSGRADRFIERFGRLPEQPPREIIPSRWRTPVFVAMIMLGMIALALLAWLVVLPAIYDQAAGGSSRGSVPSGAQGPGQRTFSE
jgi:hypothetical protein